MNQRIIGDKVDLDYRNIKEFFERRGERKFNSKYNYVLYQDDCPDLALKRDLWEKEKISQILNIENGKRVLDIGCGIGRWGEWLLEKGLYYVGIDGSNKMIDRAKENLTEYSNKKLLVGLFQELRECLEKAEETELFDMVFVNGVFMYLNDRDYILALKDIHEVCAKHCELYIKESMGVERRLTLNQLYSEVLSQSYSAIYRSIEEYKETLLKEFSVEFELVEEGSLFSEKLMNRRETIDYYFVWRR